MNSSAVGMFSRDAQALSTHTSQVPLWDTILVWAISEKLDSNTRKCWNSHDRGTISNYSKTLWSSSMREAAHSKIKTSAAVRVCSPVKQQIIQSSRQNQPSCNRNPVYGKSQFLYLRNTAKVNNKKLITAPAEIVTSVPKFISSTTVLAIARWIMTTGLQLSRRRSCASTAFARITRQRTVRANLHVESAMVSITQLFTENKKRRSPRILH